MNCIVDNYRWRLLKWVGHIARMPTTNLQWRMMTCCVNGKRPHGRPLMKWGHAVHRAFKARKISTDFHVWSKLAEDVVTWTSMIQPRIVKDKEKRYSFSSHLQETSTSKTATRITPPHKHLLPYHLTSHNTYRPHTHRHTRPNPSFPYGVFNAGRSSESRNAIRVASSGTIPCCTT